MKGSEIINCSAFAVLKRNCYKFSIFLYLQQWNELALDGSNWQHVNLFDFQTGIEVSNNELLVAL